MTSVSLSLVMSLLGSDSFVAGLIVGPFLRDWRAGASLSLGFAACDGAATLLGAASVSRRRRRRLQFSSTSSPFH